MAEETVPRMRVHEFARITGVSSLDVMTRLHEFNEYANSASSLLLPPVVRRLAQSFNLDLSEFTSETTGRASVATSVTGTSFSNEYGWHSGAIKVPKNESLQRGLIAVEAKFPEVAEHRRQLTSMGSQVIRAELVRRGPLAGGAKLRIRFSEAIESAFGLTREVLAIYLPYEDFQMRSYEASIAELRDSRNTVTPDLILIWAPDERLGPKLAEWGNLRTVSIPFQLDGANSFGLIELLQDHIHIRNLFEVTTPVSGASFFGRRTVLQGLREDVMAQRATGIFGLRKAGKTSILLELAEELLADRVVPVLVDLEALPSPPVDPTDDLLALLRLRMLESLKAQSLRVKELADLPDFPSMMQFKIALQKLLRHLDADGVRVLLMLDEVEYVTPSGHAGPGSAELPRLAQALSALRSVTQESSNMSLLLAGLTSSIVESGELHGRPNPFFSWARKVYIGPLEQAEAAELAHSLGRRMGIFIAEDALEALYEATGGHAYLYRHLASTVVKTLPVKQTNRTMARRDVLRALSGWREEVHSHIVEMIRHVEKFYPAESVLLDTLGSEPDLFPEFAATEVQATRHLVDLGLLEGNNVDGYRRAVLLEML